MSGGDNWRNPSPNSRIPPQESNWRNSSPYSQVPPQENNWFSPRYRGSMPNRHQSPRHWQRSPSTSYQRHFHPRQNNYYGSPQMRSQNFYQNNRFSTPHHQTRFNKSHQDGNSIDSWISPQMWEDPWSHLKQSHNYDNVKLSNVDIPNQTEPSTSKDNGAELTGAEFTAEAESIAEAELTSEELTGAEFTAEAESIPEADLDEAKSPIVL